MNMLSPMNANSYNDHVMAIHGAAEVVAKNSMKHAAEELKQFYEPEDGLYDVGISVDGTWRRRGYSSSYGVVTGISLVTGKVLDIEVMSKECRECMGWSSKQGTEEFVHWWEEHQHSCHANFEGSSGAMETAGCLQIFQRSVEQYALGYVDFLGDGDSKAYNEIKEASVYGEKPVTKLECVGHVQKRMGSRLRSLKKQFGSTRLSDGKSIGGKGHLTDKVIDNLQVYYGKAMRNNSHSMERMKNAIWAIWHHTKSTDANPDHNLCPKGESSWCGYQRDIVKNTQEYSHSHPLPEAVSQCILPVFTDLSKSHLLSSCLHGGIKNQNEAFIASIWQRATKETHSSLLTVELATFLAVGVFNDGSKAILDVLQNMGITPGYNTKAGMKKMYYDCLRHSTRNSSEKQKSRRKRIRQRKKGYFDKLTEKEGTHYEAGAF